METVGDGEGTKVRDEMMKDEGKMKSPLSLSLSGRFEIKNGRERNCLEKALISRKQAIGHHPSGWYQSLG